MQLLFLGLCALFMLSCSTVKTPLQDSVQENKSIIPIYSISDLKDIPQESTYFTQDIQAHYLNTQKEYEKKFFKVWNLHTLSVSLQDAQWISKAFSIKNSYGVNLQKLDKTFFQNLHKNSNYKAFASLNIKAISLKLLNIRALPTEKPIFLDPSKAGEGFPFDYLQNSTIAPNKPLLVSHFSKDKKWVFVESSFAFGWVKSDDIVFLTTKETDDFQKTKQVIITKEGTPLYAKDGTFLFQSRIGMMFPLIEENADSYTVLALSKYKNTQALYTSIRLSKKIAHLGILEFNAKNINKILKEISKTVYGWGGIFEQRDCSSTVRDFYAPFGLWLARNSYKQSKQGKIIDLEKLTLSDKITTIKKEAQPFKTLLYKKGHIVMYVGLYKGKVIIFQNVWGVKTMQNNKEGRFIIGRPVFSTLEIGKNLKNFDKNASLLKNLKSMTKF